MSQTDDDRSNGKRRNGRAFLDSIGDILRSIFAALSGSSLLKRIVGPGRINNEFYRLFSFVLSNALLGIVALVALVLLFTDSTNLPALLVVLLSVIVLVLIIAAVLIWLNRKPKDAHNRNYIPLHFYAHEVADSSSSISGVSIELMTIDRDSATTDESGRAQLKLPPGFYPRIEIRVKDTLKEHRFKSFTKDITNVEKIDLIRIPIELDKKAPFPLPSPLVKETNLGDSLTTWADSDAQGERMQGICGVRILQSPEDKKADLQGNAWLLSPNLILTCWHVVESKFSRTPSRNSADIQQFGAVELVFNGTQKLFTIPVGKLESYDVDLNFAILRIDASDAEKYKLKPRPLVLDHYSQLEKGAQLSMAQFSLEKGIQIFEGKLDSCQDDGHIFYDYNQKEYAVGAPVFYKERVIALHRGRHPATFLGEGILIGAIMEKIRTQNATLHSQILPG